jgi:hypothetical protein
LRSYHNKWLRAANAKASLSQILPQVKALERLLRSDERAIGAPTVDAITVPIDVPILTGHREKNSHNVQANEHHVETSVSPAYRSLASQQIFRAYRHQDLASPHFGDPQHNYGGLPPMDFAHHSGSSQPSANNFPTDQELHELYTFANNFGENDFVAMNLPLASSSSTSLPSNTSSKRAPEFDPFVVSKSMPEVRQG